MEWKRPNRLVRAGLLVPLVVVDSALRTFVLRARVPILTRVVFVGLRNVFETLARVAPMTAVIAPWRSPIGLLCCR
jgi:hypothetical protein